MGRAWLCKDGAVSQAEKVGLVNARWGGNFYMQCKKAQAFWQRSDKAGFMVQICSFSQQELLSF